MMLDSHQTVPSFRATLSTVSLSAKLSRRAIIGLGGPPTGGLARSALCALSTMKQLDNVAGGSHALSQSDTNAVGFVPSEPSGIPTSQRLLCLERLSASSALSSRCRTVLRNSVNFVWQDRCESSISDTRPSVSVALSTVLRRS